jgi:hypothetical protein
MAPRRVSSWPNRPGECLFGPSATGQVLRERERKVTPGVGAGGMPGKARDQGKAAFD